MHVYPERLEAPHPFPSKGRVFFYMFLPFSQRINQLMQMVCTYSFDDFDVTLVSKSSLESAFYNDCRDLFFLFSFMKVNRSVLDVFFPVEIVISWSYERWPSDEHWWAVCS